MKRYLALIATALVATAAAAAGAADITTTAYSKQVPVGATDRVNINNVAGSLNITAWDRKEVDIQGELGPDVDRVEIKQGDGGVDIRVILKDDPWNNNSWKNVSWKRSEADLRIRVPAGVRLEASTVSASLTASGLRGKTRLKSVSGDVRSDVVAPDLEAKSVSGDVELTGSGAASRLRANSVSGDVTLNKVAGDVEAKSVSGDVEIQLQAAEDVEVASVSGDVAVAGGLANQGELEAESVSGRVRITAQAPGGYHYELKSFSGRIKSCLSGGQVEDSKNGRGGSVSGTLGLGSATLRVKSHSGNVELCDR